MMWRPCIRSRGLVTSTTIVMLCSGQLLAQQSDNDYAVGALVQRLATSQYKDNTLVFVLEDDAQDGADHVVAHRSIFFVAGPYVKHGAVVSTAYTTVNLLRTIEDILGTDHLNVRAATAAPMSELFDLSKKPGILRRSLRTT
jgi:hypothetical protein